MRKFFVAAAGSVVALAGFAGVAHSSATIDLIWEDTGTNDIDNSGPQELQLNVILTAGPAGSEGAGVSVDFSSIGEDALVLFAERLGNRNPTPDNTPSVGADSVLPIEIEFPQIRESRVELINSVCFCDLNIGTGLEAGESHQLGYVTFNIAQIPPGAHVIRSDADGPSDGVRDGDGNEILPKTDITFNSAFIEVVPLHGAVPVGAAGLIALLGIRLLRKSRSR
jgi:hypothetical protein